MAEENGPGTSMENLPVENDPTEWGEGGPGKPDESKPGELKEPGSKPDDKPAGEPGEPGPDKGPDGTKSPEVEEWLKDTDFKSGEEVLKAYKLLESHSSKSLNDLKDAHKAEIAARDESVAGLNSHLEKMRAGDVAANSGADLLAQLKQMQPDMSAHFDELFNTMGEQGFKAYASVRIGDIASQKDNQKTHDDQQTAIDAERKATEFYAKYAEEKPELKDPVVEKAIRGIAAELSNPDLLVDPEFQITTFYQIHKGRQSAEDFAKAVDKMSDVKANNIINKKLANGLLVSKSAAGGGGKGTSDEQKDQDKEWGVDSAA